MSVFWFCINSKNYPACNFSALKEGVKKTVQLSGQVTREFKKARGKDKLILVNSDKKNVYGTGEILFYDKKGNSMEYKMVDKFSKSIPFSKLIEDEYLNNYNHEIINIDSKNKSTIKTGIFAVGRDLFNAMGKLGCTKKSSLSLPPCWYIQPKNVMEEFFEEVSVESSIDSIREIIAQGENNKIEFKSSIRWDYKQNMCNVEREFDILKAISAFLNSEGGTLLIGVEDSGDILGLDSDYKTLGKKPNKDGFLLHIDNIINTSLGGSFGNIKSSIQNIDSKDICILEVKRNDSPIFLKDIFYVRGGASSQPLSGNKMFEYIKNRFKKHFSQ